MLFYHIEYIQVVIQSLYNLVTCLTYVKLIYELSTALVHNIYILFPFVEVGIEHMSDIEKDNIPVSSPKGANLSAQFEEEFKKETTGMK